MTRSLLPDDPGTPLEWLRQELARLEPAGRTVGDLTRILIGRVRVDDVKHWTRPGLQAAIQKELRGQGLLVDHGAAVGRGGAPLARIEQLPFDGIVAWLEAHHRQADDTRAAAYQVAEQWVALHPEADVTADELMALAGWSAA